MRSTWKKKQMINRFISKKLVSVLRLIAFSRSSGVDSQMRQCYMNDISDLWPQMKQQMKTMMKKTRKKAGSVTCSEKDETERRRRKWLAVQWKQRVDRDWSFKAES